MPNVETAVLQPRRPEMLPGRPVTPGASTPFSELLDAATPEDPRPARADAPDRPERPDAPPADEPREAAPRAKDTDPKAPRDAKPAAVSDRPAPQQPAPDDQPAPTEAKTIVLPGVIDPALIEAALADGETPADADGDADPAVKQDGEDLPVVQLQAGAEVATPAAAVLPTVTVEVAAPVAPAAETPGESIDPAPATPAAPATPTDIPAAAAAATAPEAKADPATPEITAPLAANPQIAEETEEATEKDAEAKPAETDAMPGKPAKAARAPKVASTADPKAPPPQVPAKPAGETIEPKAPEARPADRPHVQAAEPANPAAGTPATPAEPALEHAAAPRFDAMVNVNPATAPTLPTPTLWPTALRVATDAVPIAGVAVEIASRAQEGLKRFEIRLDPPELGRIDVRLDVDRAGNVSSRLIVDRPETLDLLRRDAQSLERALQQAGLKTSENGLQFSLRDQGFAQREQTPGEPGHTRLIVPDDEAVAVEAARRGYGRLVGLGSGVDISV